MLSAAKAGRWTEARNLANASGASVKDLYQWLYYTKSAGPVAFADISAFIRAHPDWPRQSALQLAAEKAMPLSLPDAQIVAWFRAYPPRTHDAFEQYAGALRRTGQTEILRAALSERWRTARMTPEQQNRLLQAHRPLISTIDHLARLDMALKSGQYANARAIGRMLGKGYPDLVEARIALAEQSAGVDTLIARIPPHLQSDAGLAYDRLKWRRRKNMDVSAMEIIFQMPPAEKIPNPKDWWTEQHILARRLMERKQFESAYLLVSKHVQVEGAEFAAAEFLAGWLALKINEPWKAFTHFEKLYHGVRTPISRSRGAYWAGVASDRLGHPAIAQEWYRAAAQHQSAFYGQLAMSKLDAANQVPAQSPPATTVPGKTRFDNLEMVQMAKLLHQAGMRKDAGDFLTALRNRISVPEDFKHLAELSRDMDQLYHAVQVAKEGMGRNVLLMDLAFPTLLQPMRGIKTEWALCHAIIRQESAFDRDAVSSAGARGLMQLMPATAAEVARKLGVRHNVQMLHSDPHHNILLGSTYIQQMIDRYDGSYPLALAAYNAGPGRVNQWLKLYGDPRRGEIDIIDWIELIPIYETRNYVQRVLESVYVYRIKLEGVQGSARGRIHVTNR